MNKLVIILAVVLMSSGCAKKLEPVALKSPNASVTLTYQASVDANEEANYVLNNISNALQNASSVKKVNDQQCVYAESGKCVIYGIGGLRIQQTPSGLSMEYVNGELYNNRTRSYATRVLFPIAVLSKDLGNGQKQMVLTAGSGVLNAETGPIGIEYDPVLPIDKLQNDVANSIRALSGHKILSVADTKKAVLVEKRKVEKAKAKKVRAEKIKKLESTSDELMDLL